MVYHPTEPSNPGTALATRFTSSLNLIGLVVSAAKIAFVIGLYLSAAIVVFFFHPTPLIGVRELAALVGMAHL
jgi:hypothetical protein